MSTPSVKYEYDPKNMQFKRLGNSGLRVPVFSLGTWLTVGSTVKGDPVREMIKTAFESGINLIDTAEFYSAGQSEIEIGRALKELGYRRTDLIIVTKIFWGIGRKGPNDSGLSRKHVIEGLNESLERLQLDYVDVVFAHRPDPTVPMAEIVRTFNHLINTGKAYYWGTSEWSSRQIEEAFHVADELKLIAPISEQCRYNGFSRDRFEHEYDPLFSKYGYGSMVYSALAGGVFTGKYNDGVAPGTRFDTYKNFYKGTVENLQTENGKSQIEKVKQLTELAKAAKNPNSSSVILGATRPDQILDNLKALDVLSRMTEDIYNRIDKILDNSPASDIDYRVTWV